MFNKWDWLENFKWNYSNKLFYIYIFIEYYSITYYFNVAYNMENNDDDGDGGDGGDGDGDGGDDDGDGNDNEVSSPSLSVWHLCFHDNTSRPFH